MHSNHALTTSARACSSGIRHDTLVLTADLTWRPASTLKCGDHVLGFDERADPGRYRRIRVATVDELIRWQGNTITLSTEFGKITCTPDHNLLEKNRYRKAATIRELRLATATVSPPDFGRQYKMGYLRGAMAGDGTLCRRPANTHAMLRVCDASFAERFAEFGGDLRMDGFRRFTYIAGYTMRPLYGVRTSRVEEVSSLEPYSERSPTTEYMRGWLAGVFDAEGSNGGGGVIRIHQRLSNRPFWDTTARFLNTLGLPYTIEKPRARSSARRERMGSLRIGKIADQLRFVAMTQPVVERKWAYLRGAGLRLTPKASVVSRRATGVGPILSIGTSTHTIIAGGFLSHAGPLVHGSRIQPMMTRGANPSRLSSGSEEIHNSDCPRPDYISWPPDA